MPKFRLPQAFAALALLPAFPAAAEVTGTGPMGFVSRHEVVVEASPKDVWLALISPAKWWASDHTWSGDSANLTLTPQAGGCFCEKIPEVDEPGRFTLEGSVEHMRVIQAYPERALRMQGALGPLQSEPVSGVLTIAISKTEAGTRIVWEYNVGGAMRFEVPVISRAVDTVMGIQLAALAKPLGVVATPEKSAPAQQQPADKAAPADKGAAPKVAPASEPKSAVAPLAKPAAKPAATVVPAGKLAAPRTDPILAPKPEEAPATASKAASKPASKAPSVDDAFGDLEDKPPR